MRVLQTSLIFLLRERDGYEHIGRTNREGAHGAVQLVAQRAQGPSGCFIASTLPRRRSTPAVFDLVDCMGGGKFSTNAATMMVRRRLTVSGASPDGVVTGAIDLVIPAEGAQSALALELVVELHGPVHLILVCGMTYSNKRRGMGTTCMVEVSARLSTRSLGAHLMGRAC